jgi:serine/threonine protein kinase
MTCAGCVLWSHYDRTPASPGGEELSVLSAPWPLCVQAVGRVYLVMEYCGGGDLAQYIAKNGTVAPRTQTHWALGERTGGLTRGVEKALTFKPPPMPTS